MILKELRLLFWGAFAGSMGALSAGPTTSGDNARVTLVVVNLIIVIGLFAAELIQEYRASKAK